MRSQQHAIVFLSLLLWHLHQPYLGQSWTLVTPPTSLPTLLLSTSTERYRQVLPSPLLVVAQDHVGGMDATTDYSSSMPSSSRRQWFHNVLMRTTMSVVGSAASCSLSLLPSNASDLISSQAVCDSAVSVWKKDRCIIYLLGTAHISRESAALAGQLVRDTMPKGVFVELDPKRVSGTGVLAKKVDATTTSSTIEGRETEGVLRPHSRIIVPTIQAADMTLSPTSSSSSQYLASSVGSLGDAGSHTVEPSPSLKSEQDNNNLMMKAASAAVGRSIKSMYKKLDSAGFESGEEFVVAIQEGRKLGADIVLGDRDVEVTLRRVTEGLAKTDLKVLLSPDSELEQSLQELVPSNLQSSVSSGKNDLSDQEFRREFSSFVETMKAKENVRKIMAQLQRVAPYLYEALVSERDAYMAAGLNGLSNELETMVAVVGIAHADGIEKNLQMNGWKAANPSCSKFR
jgi:hypothetical protein